VAGRVLGAEGFSLPVPFTTANGKGGPEVFYSSAACNVEHWLAVLAGFGGMGGGCCLWSPHRLTPSTVDSWPFRRTYSTS